MRFSIVIPCLNRAHFLDQALASVLAQAGSDDEVLVVDGGSTDGSVEIILRHAARLAWWVSEPDSGQSAALNKGFARARGDWLLWVNADDILLPGTLAAAASHLRRRPGCRWLAGNLIYLDEEGRVRRCARDGAWHDWFHHRAPVRVYGPSSFFSRDLFQQVGGFDEALHYAMDTDLWLRFRAAGARYERLPHYCWGFRVHADSKTSADLQGNTDPRMADELKRIYARNGVRVTPAGLWQQRLWRVANGCYARTCLDTLRLRGKRVGTC